MSKCRYCGEKIVWQQTEKGNWVQCELHPIYYTPDNCGDIYVMTAQGRTIKARKGSEQGKAIYVGYVPHWSVCKKSKYGLARRREIEMDIQEEQRRKKKAELQAKEEQRILQRCAEIEEAYRQSQKEKQLSMLPEDYIGWARRW